MTTHTMLPFVLFFELCATDRVPEMFNLDVHPVTVGCASGTHLIFFYWEGPSTSEHPLVTRWFPVNTFNLFRGRRRPPVLERGLTCRTKIGGRDNCSTKIRPMLNGYTDVVLYISLVDS